MRHNDRMTEQEMKEAIDAAILSGDGAVDFDPATGKALQRDKWGRKVNETAHRRAHAAVRARALEILGLPPEGETSDERYVGSTHHFVLDARAILLGGK